MAGHGSVRTGLRSVTQEPDGQETVIFYGPGIVRQHRQQRAQRTVKISSFAHLSPLSGGVKGKGESNTECFGMVVVL